VLAFASALIMKMVGLNWLRVGWIYEEQYLFFNLINFLKKNHELKLNWLRV
jgi:hypothetical protein